MDLCEEVSELAHNVIFNIILVAVIIISTIAIVIGIWTMFKRTNRILLHQNIRTLIIVHQLWLILNCIARIFANIYVLVAYQKNYDDQCGYMLFAWECYMIRIPITLTAFLSTISIPSIVIERAFSTYFSSRYEKFGKSIAVILIIAQIVIGVGSLLYIVIDLKLLGSVRIAYCATANGRNAQKIATTLGFYATAAFRFHRNEIHVSLSHRYQIIENIKSIQTLTPMMVLHSLFLALYLGALFVYFAFGFTFSVRNAIFLESVQQTPIYALTLPIAIVWTEKHLEKTAEGNRQKAMELKGTEAANHHFVCISMHFHFAKLSFNF
uniref:G-protein coupled receptors family 1 profile domain-containing protein n=1 Tax=Onchocerca volvulus TaxID=6282 RepID=A0A8R1XS04_ONCVO